MAGGPLQRMTAGKPVASISASTWNRFGDATRRVEEAAQTGGDGRIAPRVDVRFVTLANDTGASRNPFQIVHYDEHGINEWPPNNTTYPQRAVPPANAKAPVAGERFGVLADKVESGTANVVRAQVAGLAYVLVDVKDAADDTCGPVDDQYTHLDSGTGSTPILAKALAGEVTETGVQWCVVLLGGGSGGGMLSSAFAVVVTAMGTGSHSGSASSDDFKFTPGSTGEAVMLQWKWSGSAWALEMPSYGAGEDIDDYKFPCRSAYKDRSIPVDSLVQIEFSGDLSRLNGSYSISSTQPPPLAHFVEEYHYLQQADDFDPDEVQVFYHDEDVLHAGGEECT